MDLHQYLKTKSTQSGLARQLGITQGAVYQWTKRGVPANRVLELERLSGGEMTRHELRPDLYPPQDAA